MLLNLKEEGENMKIDYEQKEFMRKYSKARNAAFREKGLCPRCGKKTDGKYLCTECSKKHADSQSTAYQKKKAKGICVRCHKKLTSNDHVLCEECLSKTNEDSRKSYAYFKSRRICTRCHKEKAEDGHILCAACLEKCRRRT